MPTSKPFNIRGMHGSGMPFLVRIGKLLLLAPILSGCGGPTGSIVYDGFPAKNKSLSAAAKDGVLSSVQIVVISPDEHCANGGVKLVNTSNPSEAPVYVCSEATERIYGVTNTDVSALPATGALSVCSNDAESNCLASGNYKVVNSALLDATKIATGTTVAGVAGSLANCSLDGQTGCVSTSAFKSVDMTKLTEGNIKNGVSIAGVTGAYPSAAFKLAGDTVTADLPAFASTVGGSTYEWFTADGTLISGTIMADQTVTPSTTAQNFNGGLYRSVSVAGDANLVAAKILSNNSIFGVAGNVTLPAAAAVRSSAFFGAASATQGSIADCSANGSEGCYTTSTYKSADLTNLVEGNIKNGATIAGVAGKYPNATYTLTGSAGNDLPSLDSTVAAGTYQFFKSDGTRVTGAITDAGSITPTGSLQTFATSLYKGFSVAAASVEAHSDCSSGVSTGCVATATFKAFAQCTTDGGVDCAANTAYKSAKMSDFDTWSIVAGKTIAGVAGSAYVGSLLSSGAHHDRNSTPGNMTYAQELGLGASTLWSTIASGNTGYGYREVPLIANDDDGYTASTNPVTKLTRPTVGTWGGSGSGARVVCGKSATSVATKITNCGTNNPNAATWNGVVTGVSGEGSWTLVTVYSASLADGATCDATCYEVWRDNRTGLLWSDKLADTVGGSTTYNWCHASGSNNSTSGSIAAAYKGTDPNGYCAPAAAQGAGANQTDPPQSLCFEDTGFVTSTNLDPMKGNMHKHTGSATVKWRLPTKHDFEIAEHNGIRHVLPNMATTFWSASVNSNNRVNAWQFNGSFGGVSNLFRISTIGVRCVGGE